MCALPIYRWNMGLQTVANQFRNIEPLEHGVANQFLTMEPLEHAVVNSCKSVSKYGTVGTWGCKQLQMSFKYGTVRTSGCKQLQIRF